MGGRLGRVGLLKVPPPTFGSALLGAPPRAAAARPLAAHRIADVDVAVQRGVARQRLARPHRPAIRAAQDRRARGSYKPYFRSSSLLILAIASGCDDDEPALSSSAVIEKVSGSDEFLPDAAPPQL